ncbi:MAG: hypothetical protein EA378_09570 [Phycisphaerales bacterium]|nr:MAG: hypothetical protein EA378_09570 [Phycisphaerales bacterium]
MTGHSTLHAPASTYFRSRRWRAFLAACIAGAISTPTLAQQPQHPDDDEPLIASLITEHSHAVPGETFYIGVHMRLAEDWHTYWDGLNDTGFAATVKLDLPAGWTAGEIQWPAPERYITSGGLGLDHVYHRDTTLIIPIQVPADATVGETVTITADAEWLVCQDACIPGWATLTLETPVRAETATASDDASLFAATRERTPVPLERADDERLSAEMDGRDLVIRARGASKVAFYPSSASAAPEDIMRTGEAQGDRLRLRFQLEPTGEKPVTGIIAIFATDGTPSWYAVTFPHDG